MDVPAYLDDVARRLGSVAPTARRHVVEAAAAAAWRRGQGAPVEATKLWLERSRAEVRPPSAWLDEPQPGPEFCAPAYKLTQAYDLGWSSAEEPAGPEVLCQIDLGNWGDSWSPCNFLSKLAHAAADWTLIDMGAAGRPALPMEFFALAVIPCADTRGRSPWRPIWDAATSQPSLQVRLQPCRATEDGRDPIPVEAGVVKPANRYHYATIFGSRASSTSFIGLWHRPGCFVIDAECWAQESAQSADCLLMCSVKHARLEGAGATDLRAWWP